MSEDETRCDTHEELQEKDSWRLPYLQAVNCIVLLSCKTLQGEQVPCAVLSEHQAKASSTESGAKVSLKGILLIN